MSLVELIHERRKKIENEEKSDDSDVVESSSDGHAEDSDDEIRMYRKGGYFEAKENQMLKENKHVSWKIINKLGRGHFSTVWRVQNVNKTDENRDEYAMKIQKSAKHYRTSAREEIFIHEMLKKESGEGKTNICMMHSSFFHNGPNGKHFCMVFPIVDCDLCTFMESFDKEMISLDLTSKISHEILKGVAFLHHNSIIHADLKPENILVKKNEEIEFSICDLGTACIEGDREVSYIQTSHYRSPEIFMHHRKWDCKIDIWSVACIIFECITGDYLFSGEQDEDYITNFIETIGIPPRSFVDECKEKRKFFNRDHKYIYAHDLKPMSIDRILQERYEFDRKTSMAINHLLQPMLIWDINSRWSAKDLLRLYET